MELFFEKFEDFPNIANVFIRIQGCPLNDSLVEIYLFDNDMDLTEERMPGYYMILTYEEACEFLMNQCDYGISSESLKRLLSPFNKYGESVYSLCLTVFPGSNPVNPSDLAYVEAEIRKSWYSAPPIPYKNWLLLNDPYYKLGLYGRHD